MAYCDSDGLGLRWSFICQTDSVGEASNPIGRSTVRVIIGWLGYCQLTGIGVNAKESHEPQILGWGVMGCSWNIVISS